MEAKVIQKLFPKLISAISTCAQNVSDHCFSESLIEETTWKKVLESAGTDKARILISAVRETVDRNPTCFNVFVNILEKTLPSIDDPLLKAMKAAVTSNTSEVAIKESQIPSLPNSPDSTATKKSDTCQLQQTANPSSEGDFILNRCYDLALKGAEESKSVTSESAFSERATSDTPKTVFESSESQHGQIAVSVITDYHRGTLVPNQSCILYVQGEGDVESAMTPTSKQHHDFDNSNELSAVQVQGEYQVKLNQDIEVC